MKKKFLCLVMGLVMAAGMSTTAFAQDYQGASDCKSEFNGNDIVTNFAISNVADSMKQVLPGDSI